jgi:hypothetical protein
MAGAKIMEVAQWIPQTSRAHLLLVNLATLRVSPFSVDFTAYFSTEVRL